MAECNHSRRRANGSCRTCDHMRWVVKNRESIREYDREHYQKHREKMTEAHRRHRAKDPDRYRSQVRKYRENARNRAMDMLGGVCSRCGFADRRALEFDHIVAIRKTVQQRKFRDSWLTIFKMKNPSAIFSLLCANCHAIKTKENGEHAMRGSRAAIAAQKVL